MRFSFGTGDLRPFRNHYTFPGGNLQIFFRSVIAMTLSSVFGKLSETAPVTLAVIVLLLAFAFAMFRAGKKVRWDARSLAYAALCVALSYILSCIRLYRFAFGGSITLLSMLPILMFSLAQGTARGSVIGCAYGLLQLIQDFYFAHPAQLLLDYPVAFAMLGLAGFARHLPKSIQIPAAVIFGAFGRYIVHVISGAVFFGSYAAPGQTALAYSLIYNLGYMGPDAALCLVAAITPIARRILKLIPRK